MKLVDKNLLANSADILKTKIIGTKEEETFQTGSPKLTNALLSTFCGWMYVFEKAKFNDFLISITATFSLYPTTSNIHCVIYDGNLVELKDIVISATNGTEIEIPLNISMSRISTSYFYIGFYNGTDRDQTSRMMVYIYGLANSEYSTFVTPYTTKYKTNDVSGWQNLNNAGTMNYKNACFVFKSCSLEKLVGKEELGWRFTASKNLVDLAKAKDGYLMLYSDGVIYSGYSTYFCTDYIEVEPNTEYTLSGGYAGYPNQVAHNGYAFYDEDKVFISGQAPQSLLYENKINFTTPNNAKYIVLSYRMDDKTSNIQLEKGSVKTDYTPYKDYIGLDNVLLSSDQIVDANYKYIKCDEQYDLVVGSPFELFYKGIINAFDYKQFSIYCQCDIGKCLERKFAIDNVTASMVGNHSLTITIKSNLGVVLQTKTINLKVSAKATSPVSEKVILCIGDSLTQGGQWVDEFARMLKTTSSQTNYGASALTGLGLSNITFIGKKTSVGGYKYEGYGGWDFASYLLTSASTAYWVNVASHNKTSADQESIWKDANDVQWQLETIEANKLMFKKYSGTGVMPASGTLTWVSGGVNHENIVFTSSEIGNGNPFVYDGEIDFEAYCEDMGVSTIDEVYILLGWNNATEVNPPDMTNCKAFIDLLKEFNASIKVVLIGIQIPALEGCGINYGATGIYSQYMKLVNYVHNLDDAYKSVVEEYTDVYSVNLSGQFDTEFNMETMNMQPNVRNANTIPLQSNAVHPAITGYYQIADVAYRWYNGNS